MPDTIEARDQDLFLLQERLNDIDRRVRSLYRWGITQRVFLILKLTLFAILIVTGLSAYNRYFPQLQDEFLAIYRQMRAGLDTFSDIERFQSPR